LSKSEKETLWEKAIAQARVSRWLSISGGLATVAYLGSIGQLTELAVYVIVFIVMCGVAGEAIIDIIKKPSVAEEALRKLVEKATSS